MTGALGLTGADLILAPEAPLGDAAARLEGYAGRRSQGEPLSRILGRREFWSLTFAVTPHVLDPRADTETLVEAAVDALSARRGEALRILDFGTGSGALLCALLAEFPNAQGLGLDVSPEAAATARANVEVLGFGPRARVEAGDWGRGLAGPFDLIVSNPPYIRSADLETLGREVREHDPRLALDGGADGLCAYRSLAPEIARLLAFEGLFLLEIGEGQGDEVRALMRAAGLDPSISRADLSGRERVVGGLNGA